MTLKQLFTDKIFILICLLLILNQVIYFYTPYKTDASIYLSAAFTGFILGYIILGIKK